MARKDKSTNTGGNIHNTITWLKGDEVLLYADGTLTDILGGIVSGGPGIRTAIAVFPTAEIPKAESLMDFKEKSMAVAIRDRIGNVRKRLEDIITTRTYYPYIYNNNDKVIVKNDPKLASSRERLNQKYSIAENAVAGTLKTISADIEKWLSTAEVQENFLESRNLLAPSDHQLFPQCKNLIQTHPLFTEDLQKLFASECIPITISTNIFKLKTLNSQFYVAPFGNGVFFNPETLQLYDNSPSDRLIISANIAKGLITAAMSEMGIKRENLGLKDDRQWESIVAEFTRNPDIPLPKPSDDPEDHSAINIMTSIHITLCQGGQDARIALQGMVPKSLAMYDNFMTAIRTRVKLREGKPLHNPSRLPNDPVIQSIPVLPPVPPPRYSEKEQVLIDAVQPFIRDALSDQLPYNQFRCNLVLNDNNRQDNYPISITLLNSRGLKRSYSINTGTNNLDEAIALKKMLQSHILNLENHPIIPCYLHGSDTHSRLAPLKDNAAMIPPDETGHITLQESGGYYTASIHCTDNDFSIPLGMRCDGDNHAVAENRLTLLENHLKHLREQKQWETLGEITQHLKSEIMNSKTSDSGWRVADTMPLEYYGTKNPIDLGFPASGKQSTQLASAVLRLENADGHNPNWRLHFRIAVSGVDGQDNKPRIYKHTINLHTHNEIAAWLRAGEAMQALIEESRSLGENFPELHWQLVGDGREAGNLALRLPNDRLLTDPQPQNLFHLVDDLPNPKVNFHLKYTEIPAEIAGKTNLMLTVERGTAAEDDMWEMKDRNGTVTTRTLQVDTDKLPSVKAALDRSFNGFIQEAYGNRTSKSEDKPSESEGKRKSRQKFRPETIKNLLKKAVVQIVRDKTAIDLDAPVEKPQKNAAKAVETTTNTDPSLNDAEKPEFLQKIINAKKEGRQKHIKPSRGIPPSKGERIIHNEDGEHYLYMMKYKGKFVYKNSGLMAMQNATDVKIGYSNNVEERLKSLNAGIPPDAINRWEIHAVSEPFPDAMAAFHAEKNLKQRLQEQQTENGNLVQTIGGEFYRGDMELIQQEWRAAAKEILNNPMERSSAQTR